MIDAKRLEQIEEQASLGLAECAEGSDAMLALEAIPDLCARVRELEKALWTARRDGDHWRTVAEAMAKP